MGTPALLAAIILEAEKEVATQSKEAMGCELLGMGIDHDAASPIMMDDNADVYERLPPDVKLLYGIIQRHTGGLGGNGSGGPIYGELAKGSMQKVVNKMIKLTGLSKNSRVIDIRCGLGKPSIHFF